MVSRGWEYACDMHRKTRLCESSYMVISGRSRGGDARTHNLPLTWIYKGIFVQVPACAWFYKSENLCVRKNRAFVPMYSFKIKSTESFYKWGAWWEYASLVKNKFCLQQRKTSLLLAYIEILRHFIYLWRFSTAWYGTVRHGSVRYGTAQFGSVCISTAV